MGRQAPDGVRDPWHLRSGEWRCGLLSSAELRSDVEAKHCCGCGAEQRGGGSKVRHWQQPVFSTPSSLSPPSNLTLVEAWGATEAGCLPHCPAPREDMWRDVQQRVWDDMRGAWLLMPGERRGDKPTNGSRITA
ncbi:hypothetical protein NDU88_003223 [Pleurodeles waltl]|uniref:Uncharacterized protein n=1 Tax=Pleurodeles waltl TaxID=8319 RepID=A0AAV7WNU9_PLEWA|nr:hypothetical protein NDU88_003223 [Pleurodeles waltl]